VQTFEPEGASRWSHDEDELFERHAKSALRDMKTSDWKHADVLWQGLQIVPLATTKRIIAHAILICAQRGESPPVELGDVAIWLLVGERSRFRVHDPTGFNAAKSYAVRNPRASLREIAEFAGVHYTSVRDWKKKNFVVARNDLPARIVLATYIKYCSRFGSPFGIKSELGKDFLFFAYFPLIKDALSQRRPISEAEARAQHTFKQPSAWARRYIVGHAIRFCAKRRKALPMELAKTARRLLVRGKPRYRARDPQKLIKAASILASQPQASLRDIGRAVGVDHTAVRLWVKQDRFKKELEEQRQRRAVSLYREYCRRFGSPFASGDFPKPIKVDLVSIAPMIEKALVEGRAISDEAAFAAAVQV
jgi:hypothetical protein